MKELNTIHLNGLRAAEAVGRLGSLAAAADELGVTPGAVSQQIAKIEAQLGRTLFERSPRGLVVTDSARPLMMRLSNAFAELAEAVAQVRRRDESVLTVSVAPVFAARWLVYRLNRFAERHPEIRLRIDATTRLANLETSDVDLAIRVGAGGWPGVRAELLLEQEVFPVCSPALAAGLREPVDILNLPAVIDEHAMFSWEVWLKAACLSGAQMTVRHTFNDASLALDAAIAGQGVMIAWQTLAGYAVMKGSLVAPFGIRAKTGFGHYFVTSASRRESKAVTAFKRWVREEVEEGMRQLSAIPSPSAVLPSSP
ncbi:MULTISPECIES: LysR substrate-binding domain-containing protein [Sinorhizobium]|uniref:LysR family transcriptional regulator n=1 Tax=Sinorhizobium americanum TaxID=194963 RepID=A0A2S3YHI0_9HYPH|nr:MULTISPECIES: LysR substrate-binding domain-containing protein [Sinorhizobium]ASY55644.1 Glycine cleavage system transcriptional activator [Sinorhizobium sp. CCBAU 05631]PDT40601.1 LysR family transcriptional regulator [Sinorhizobium sp. FG01]PDT52306.1 LysR family transcriptional regulator [Sinorhizobium sp. NG07B]POH26199.1 LysR family transcriptional regulator [Sinorhizobium americanum]POH28039.1 LysR family transcriptional regulator [Sinorhizobium americanum]